MWTEGTCVRYVCVEEGICMCVEERVCVCEGERYVCVCGRVCAWRSVWGRVCVCGGGYVHISLFT